ncbi:EAL domain-containing protein (putative c-di-GMP-specific phosphodiesterase class I)/CHASE2 domain-containing sensor protein [Sphingopyxis panaciterrae]|uniref:EAL domain-containing protein n=1 Tax=Sphingopyxis panaciterrae TaxID=363841 RepID=UPI003132F4CA|nr:EAL domain-containing protein (putative c-di-GMP-specific phosphodiesterase class I)/CHASE2 domain-containing sensor protein [Sphingopyxis panaciterrae]
MFKLGNKMIVSWRTLALSLLLSLAVGFSGIGIPVDRILGAAAANVVNRPVSGDIVVVALDDRSLALSPNASFSMTQYARVVEAIDRAGAKRMFLDFFFDRRENDRDFPQLTSAIRKMGDRAVLAVATKGVPGTDRNRSIFPNPAFGTAAKRASIAWDNEFWQVWHLPLAYVADGQLLPSFASLLADKPSNRAELFRLDFSYDTASIKQYSASELLSGAVGAKQLAGKDVIFAPTALSFQDVHYLPGHNQVPGAYIHVIGGETLKNGHPVDIGWWPALLLVVLGLTIALLPILQRWFVYVALASVAVLIIGQIILSTMLVTTSIGAALFFVATVSANVSRKRRHFSAQRENPVSGLPNFEALRTRQPFGSATIIAAKLVNFEDLAAFLPGEGSQQLVDQVARRLTLACHGTQLHHDLDGTFAWLVPYYQHSQIEGHLAGLAALFNAPLTIGELRVDVAIAFGVNDEFEGSNAQRLAAALVAAEKSVRSRALWTKYSPRQKEDAGWQLSFHSQLEDALTGGDIWVAFQPQYEIATSKLVGVEALARWTHPTRGPIPPDEFIVQAEKSQDIYRLTLFVMDQAIRSIAQLHARGFHIHMSVNLSATLLDHSDLVGTIRVMLTAHHLSPEWLTIEITETAQIENSRQARQTLAQLRRAGIRLSIDDYGTGQSNLEYLTEIEADEIKIDKRFVMTMRDSQRNFEVVKSTIDLAHRLGATAVAEGIEDRETMTLLEGLGCDVGQGYHLGKPQLFSELSANLSVAPHSRTA